jgi:hypothetical protein
MLLVHSSTTVVNSKTETLHEIYKVGLANRPVVELNFMPSLATFSCENYLLT